MKKITFLTFIVFLSITGFSQKAGTGLNFDDGKYNKVLQKAPLTRELYSNIPTSHSLKKFTPYPKTQGQYGTCVGWSSAYAAFTTVHAMKNNITDRSIITDNAFSPGYLYSQIKNSADNNCSVGAYISDALEVMKTKGVPFYKDMTVRNCPSYISQDIFTKASKHRVKDYAKIFGLYDNGSFKISAVKKSLSQNNPVIIGMSVPNSFYKAKGAWTPTENSNLSYSGHAMCVIGYDDNMYGGSFEIMNSWGNWWGNDGYIYVKYDTFEQFVKYAFEIIDIESGYEIKESNFAGKLKFILSDGTEAKASLTNGNIYKINKQFKSGTLFRMYISNNEPAYVYAFGTDATKKIFPVFPHKPNISAALTYKQNDVAIPDENHYIQTDNTIGTDYLCILYSKEALSINEIQNKIENTTGSFPEKIRKVLSNKLVNNKDINYSNNNISFNGKSKNKTVVALIVKTEHVK